MDNQRIINFEILRNRTTIYDIARALNIPVATVSRALNGSVLIKDQLREEITAAAKELNYHPNRLASALKTKKTFMLGVLIPSLDSHFYASILHHIEREVKLNGFKILTIQTKGSLPNEINGFKTFLEAQVDGIIASILPQTEEMLHVKQVILMDKPLILLNSTNPEIQASSVSINYYQAGFMATEHLILKGCKTIAFLTKHTTTAALNEQILGYKSALDHHQIPFNRDHIISGELSIKDGRYGASKLFRNRKCPDAIIAGDDFTALGVMKKIEEFGKQVRKIAVMGCSNEAFSEHITPSLTSINQHPEKVGYACARLFIKMTQTSDHNDQINHILISPSIIQRESTDLLPNSV